MSHTNFLHFKSIIKFRKGERIPESNENKKKLGKQCRINFIEPFHPRTDNEEIGESDVLFIAKIYFFIFFKSK